MTTCARRRETGCCKTRSGLRQSCVRTQRLTNFGSDALTAIDALTLLLDTSDPILAASLLAEFGSLTGLARATLANLRRVLPETKAAPLVAALPLPPLSWPGNPSPDPSDNPR